MSSMRPWERLRRALAREQAEQVSQRLSEMSEQDTMLAVSRLTPQERDQLFNLLPGKEAAQLLDELPEEHSALILESLDTRTAAALVDQLPSNEQTDLLARLDDAAAFEILQAMQPEEAADVRQLSRYAADTAGGLMITEFLSYRESTPVEEIVRDLRDHADRYRAYDIQYAYVLDHAGRLSGVLRLRDLLLATGRQQAGELVIRNPLQVTADASLDELAPFFDRHPLFGVPVVDGERRMLGVVRRADVQEAEEERSARTLLKVAGILGGEELRSLPTAPRLTRRVSWLTLNLLMDFAAVSVIAVYEETVASVVALAVFLPIISDMGGNAGSQSIAVSIRELTLGMVRTQDLWYVVRKEAIIGLISGAIIGLLTGLAAWAWKGLPALGLVVAVAMWGNLIIAACCGGIVPLLLRRCGLDPAMVSGPILTTVTDVSGFFFTLVLATAMLPHLIVA